MKESFSKKKLTKILLPLDNSEIQNPAVHIEERRPVHVVYGGAHLYKAETPDKLGKLALQALDTYAPNFAEFARAMWLKGADALPVFADAAAGLELQFLENEEKIKRENFPAWFALTVYQKTLEKLEREPVEDFRIDFEDGYGLRPDEEEDRHAISASDELAKACGKRMITPFSGIRIKSFAPETYRRAVRTLDLFLTNLVEKNGGKLPANFAVTLPKIKRREEVEVLTHLLSEFENKNKLEKDAIRIEIMIETPQAVEILRELVEAGKGRVNSAHFGAYDYTASLGITGIHQHLRHEACNFARQLMLIRLAPLGIRLSDSVTTEMPIPLHRGENLTREQAKENRLAVYRSWRRHFNNITHSLISGFYQSWDLHPAQLAARYAALFAFFLESKDEQAKRLRGFIEKATQAVMTGNTFDDAASAQGLLNFFMRALNSGAMDEKEILEATGINANELSSASFLKIMENRRKRAGNAG